MKTNRYRLRPEIARKLGLQINKNNRYRLSPFQLKELYGFSQKPLRRLFFDIETSPMVVYSWRIGYNINLSYDNIVTDWKVICICYKWEGEDEVHSLRWDNYCDKKMLEDFIKVANGADELIAHNGDRFDLKKIRTRCVYHRIPMFPHYRTLDTLKKSRSGFSFDSNRLDYIAKYLGVGQKIKSEFNLWKQCMEGNEKALNDMVDYCKGDVVVLEDVFFVLQDYIKNNTHNGVVNGGYKHECPTCGSEDTVLYKNNVTASGTIKRLMECETCNYHYEISNRSYLFKLEMEAKKKMAKNEV